jgi:hypothetical protein
MHTQYSRSQDGLYKQKILYTAKQIGVRRVLWVKGEGICSRAIPKLACHLYIDAENGTGFEELYISSPGSTRSVTTQWRHVPESHPLGSQTDLTFLWARFWMLVCWRDGDLCLVGRRAISFEEDIIHDATRLATDFLLEEPQKVFDLRFISCGPELGKLILGRRLSLGFHEARQVVASPLLARKRIERSPQADDPIVWSQRGDELDDALDVGEILEDVSSVCARVFPRIPCERVPILAGAMGAGVPTTTSRDRSEHPLTNKSSLRVTQIHARKWDRTGVRSTHVAKFGGIKNRHPWQLHPNSAISLCVSVLGAVFGTPDHRTRAS